MVIPPSLVLILLGDAMLSAHTFAINATGRTDRVINTQDVLRAAIVPAALFLVLSLVAGWYSARHRRSEEPSEPKARLCQGERYRFDSGNRDFSRAAAGWRRRRLHLCRGGSPPRARCFLMLVGVLTRQVDGKTLGPMLTESMATTGTLFAPPAGGHHLHLGVALARHRQADRGGG